MTWPVLLAVLPGLFTGADSSGYVRVTGPGVRYRMNMATATRAPWVDSNLWQYRRNPRAKYLCDVGEKSVPVAMAEAFAAGVPVAMKISPPQKRDFDEMLEFLKAVPDGPKTPWANLQVTDDGSAAAGEALNLLSRRSLLYDTAPAAGVMKLALDSKIGNVYDFVLDARDKLGDDKRALRLYGTELAIAHLTREGNRVRLHLINYGGRPVEQMRIRLAGNYSAAGIQARSFRHPSPQLSEFEREGGFTEFTLDSLPFYAVLDFAEARGSADWQPLFDGTSLQGWRETPFTGRGQARVEKGGIVLGPGSPMTGVNFTGTFPKSNYEVRFEAMRVRGNDFFASLTFPVADAFCTWVTGGWGGDIVGLSSIDGWDASENETRSYFNFENGRWYKLSLRVTDGRITASIDGKPIVNANIAGRAISLRRGEIQLSTPFGFASYATEGAVRNIEVRLLP